jgi:hypothetical protein
VSRRTNTRDVRKMSDPEVLLRRPWIEGEPGFVDPLLRGPHRQKAHPKPPPDRARQRSPGQGAAPIAASDSPGVEPDYTPKRPAVPRRKRRQAPSFKLVRIGRKLLDRRPRP